MRRGPIVSLVLLSAVIGAAVTMVAVFVDWLPEQASRERGRIDFVFWLTTGICIAIFALVSAVILYSVVKFRARPDDESDGAPIHGHTGLEIAWTAVPTILVVVIGVASAIVLAQNGRSADDAMRVEVTARQFAWTFKYLEEPTLTSTTLRLPVGKPVLLELKALDVIHSFWVPEFGQKQDAVPGIRPKLPITPTKTGTFPIICTELCGLGHAFMRSRVEVMEQAAFDAWRAKQRKAISGSGDAAGKTIFTEAGCGGCHAFTPAGTSAKVGPSLDELAAQARGAKQPVERFVRESIVDPNAYVERGYPPNVMPKTYTELPDEQLDALVEYLLKGQERGKR